MLSSEATKQAEMLDWLVERTGLCPTKNIQCLATVSRGIILGVVGFDNYTGENGSIQMHVAGEPGWLTRGILRAAFDYPFNVCKVNMILGFTPSGNKEAIKFNLDLGFKVLNVVEGAHPDGALWIFSMRRGECRYLNRNSNGQEVISAATA